MNLKKLNDLLSIDEPSLLADIQTLEPTLWDDMTDEKLGYLSLDYLIKNYDMILSFTLQRLYELSEAGTFSDTPYNYAIHSLASKYADKWEKLYSAMKAQYSLLNNYSITEIRSPDLEETIDNSENSKSQTTTNSGLYGFNSDTLSPSSSTDSTSEGLEADNHGTSTKTNTGTETTTKTGNIGRDNQDMILKEIELRKTLYWEMVFDDISSELLKGIY